MPSFLIYPVASAPQSSSGSALSFLCSNILLPRISFEPRFLHIVEDPVHITSTVSFSRAYRSLIGALPQAVRAPSPLAAVNMTWLNRMNPTPAFPSHTGPYKVGSVDIEIPTSELDNPSTQPIPGDLPTVSFRVFYPAKQESNERSVRWIPSPQREYISAYARFLGANSAFAGVFS
jgi:hypothetical protein